MQEVCFGATFLRSKDMIHMNKDLWGRSPRGRCPASGCWAGTGGDSRVRNKITGTCKHKLQVCLKSSLTNTFLCLQRDSRSNNPSCMGVFVTNPILEWCFLTQSAIHCFWGTRSADWCGAKNKCNTFNARETRFLFLPELGTKQLQFNRQRTLWV